MPTKKEQDKINLRGTHKFTADERRAGGIRSAQKRKELKSLNEVVCRINAMQALGKMPNDILQRYGDFVGDEKDGFEMNNQAVFAFRVFSAAMSGDTRAMKQWMEMSDHFSDQKKALEIEKLSAEVEKLRAEVEAMKRDRGQGSEAPTFIYKFDDFSMDDGDNG